MKEQKKNHKPQFVTDLLPDEKGSVLLTTLIVLLLLTLIGIGGINTATTDLQITRNYRVHKENLVLAEGTLNYAMTMVEQALDENPAGRSWVRKEEGVKNWDGVYLVDDLKDQGDKYFKDGSDYKPSVDPVTNAIDVDEIIDDWDTIDEIEPKELDSGAEYVAYVQISLGELETRTTSAVVIARSQENGGNIVLEKGIIYTE